MEANNHRDASNAGDEEETIDDDKFLIPAVPDVNKLMSSPSCQFESTAILEESVTEEACSKNRLESTRISNEKQGDFELEGDLSKVAQEEGDSRNPLNAAFLGSDSIKADASNDREQSSECSTVALGTEHDSEPESGAADRNETESSDPEVEQLMQLPSTVTELTSREGVKIYIVGTAHFSLESQEDVAKTIQKTRPRVVMVELCVSRLNILRYDEHTLLEEAKNIDLAKIRSTVKQYGAVQGALYLLFLSTSAHLTRQLGMAPGGEFRRAWNEARNVQGCRIHLGDRPIHITLHRALAALSLWQKAKLVWHLLLNRSPISAEDVEKCKQKDLLEEMLEEMTGEFPTLSRVFVQERDLCLAHSLQLAAADAASDGAQLNETPTVVGVVGIGHVSGIAKYFGQVRESDVRKVMQIPPRSRASRLFVLSLKLSMAGLVCYGCYKVAPKLLPFNLSSIRPAFLSR